MGPPTPTWLILWRTFPGAEGAEATDLAAAVVLSKQVDNRIGAVGPPADHDATGAMRSWTLEQPRGRRGRWHVVRSAACHSRRSSRHLGWG